MSQESGRFEGKVAIVTASTEGIGFAIAKKLAEGGCSVMISSRREKNVSRAVKELKNMGLKVEGLPCHVGKAEDREKMIQATLDQFGGIDILVSNAAVNPAFGPALNVINA